jgi:hypothetical protein
MTVEWVRRRFSALIGESRRLRGKRAVLEIKIADLDREIDRLAKAIMDVREGRGPLPSRRLKEPAS